MTISNDQLAVSIAVVETDVKHMKHRLDAQDNVLREQSHDLKQLLAMSNRSKGAVWAFMGVVSALSAVIAWALSKYFG